MDNGRVQREDGTVTQKAANGQIRAICCTRPILNNRRAGCQQRQARLIGPGDNPHAVPEYESIHMPSHSE